MVERIEEHEKDTRFARTLNSVISEILMKQDMLLFGFRLRLLIMPLTSYVQGHPEDILLTSIEVTESKFSKHGCLLSQSIINDQ